ncbi:alpha-1,2-fucosyltransferase [Methanolobus sediminis]|uniref:Alpha-1,2-fucosyltransferase n=1 Tax=Methanolobus sediminis TaxID=3072978 RepID=A0AA51UIQ8_9EURY|nr:alpha-1,2-fucosyltransferase [Methanolobus sediminis]WMW24308.1 alpha-1,2-fucosyltransferase [Methanolobus sediminis]
MIIVKLMGGLGNQMFQYAAGRRLALEHNTILKLDLSFLLDRTPRENFTYRPYELDVFNIQGEIASPSEINKFAPANNNIFNYIKQKLKISKIITEPHFHFDKGILSSPDNSYLDGYWQSEKYFKEIRDIIHTDFTFKVKPTNINQKLANEIGFCESVSIHIRRGDYVSNPETKKLHGYCSLEYYEKAIKKICCYVENPHFFIFSDDPDWAEDNLIYDCPIKFVTHNDSEKGYEDLRLMSLCKHNIIANSSFSWWGAWLNKNPEKIVLSPEKWFNDSSINTDDLVPDNWIRT